MKYKRLFIWVEGDDDERFFNSRIRPMFSGKYDLVEVRPYARLKPEKVSQFLKSIKAIGSDYIFIGDINSEPCATTKKQKILNTYDHVDHDKIIIVVKEIESWYLAGLSDTNCRKFKLSPFKDTDKVNKEQFNSLMASKFDSRIDFMLEIIKYFSIETAKQKNRSFRYFCERHKL